jgi:hypothetical protein
MQNSPTNKPTEPDNFDEVADADLFKVTGGRELAPRELTPEEKAEQERDQAHLDHWLSSRGFGTGI